VSLLFSVTFLDKACIVLALVLLLLVVGLLVAPSRPPPVVGQVLPFHDPKSRTPFRSTRRKP
jgi:hypothetical protein